MYPQIKIGLSRFLYIVVMLGLVFPLFSKYVFAQQNRGVIVQTERVQLMTLPNLITIGGAVIAANPVAVTASLTAKIKMLDLQIGDMVSAGDVIAQQDTSELEHQLLVHQSELETTQNEIASLRVNLDFETSLILLVEEQITLVRKRAEYAKKLAQSNAISLEDAENAQISLNTVRQQLIMRNKTLTEIGSTIRQLELTEAQLSFTIDKLKQDLKNATLTSPVNGQIISLFAEQSGFAREGDMIAKIRTEQGYEVEIDLPVKYASFLRPNEPIFARTQNGENIKLSLSVILPEENRRTASRITRLHFLDEVPEVARSNGAQIDVLVPSSTIEELLVIPQDAIVPVSGGHIVFVFDEGVARRQAVKLGSAIDGAMIITSGLQPGELVITRGNEGLNDGAAVKQGKIPTRKVPSAEDRAGSDFGGSAANMAVPTELAEDARSWLLKWQTNRGEQSGIFVLSSKASLYNDEPVLVTKKNEKIYFDTDLVLPFGIITLSFALSPAPDSLNGTVILSGLPNGREVEIDVSGSSQ